MNDETAREKLATRLCEAFTNRPFSAQSGEVREIWRGRADALLPVVREILAEDLREAAEDVDLCCTRIVCGRAACAEIAAAS